MRNNFQLKTKDKRFMKLALQEAAKADHQVFPNPKVGAIAVSYTHLRAHETG